MHYYKRNLGDYAKKAGRLTMLQHGAYTLLIDSCYDREVFPTMEQALEWTWASSEAEIEAVKFVLSRYFVLDKDGCYVQDRILQELLQYHKNADINKRIADEREAKRREKSTNRAQTVDEAPPNHKPITINQELKEKKTLGKRLATDFQFPLEWEQFCQQTRPELNPTRTFDQFKDYWIAQAGQKGVKLDWSATWRNWVRSTNAPKQNPADIVRITVPASNEPDPALLKIKQDEKVTRPPTPEERAILNSYRRKA